MDSTVDIVKLKQHIDATYEALEKAIGEAKLHGDERTKLGHAWWALTQSRWQLDEAAQFLSEHEQAVTKY